MSNRHQPFADLVERKYEVVLRSGDEWMVRCTEHEDRSASLQINVEKGLGVCFSCGMTLGPKTLTGGAKVIDVEIEDILDRLDALEAAVRAPVRPIALPESMLRRYSFPTDYWASRGLTEAQVKQWELGYDPLENNAIIPARNMHGRLIGFIRRSLDGGDGPKYMYSKGLQRKINLYASWMINRTPTDWTCITEGAMDTIPIWGAGFPSVAQYGSSISAEQVIVLRRLGITRVTLFYDNDAAGFHAVHVAMGTPTEGCLRCAPHLKRPWQKMPVLLRDFMVNVVDYQSKSAKDPGVLSEDEIAAMIESAVRL